MTHADWVPTELITLWKIFGEVHRNDPESLRLYELLTSRLEVRTAWGAVQKHSHEKHPAFAWAVFCQMVILAKGPNDWSRLTGSQQREKVERIKKHVGALLSELEGGGPDDWKYGGRLDAAVLGLVPDHVWADLDRGLDWFSPAARWQLNSLPKTKSVERPGYTMGQVIMYPSMSVALTWYLDWLEELLKQEGQTGNPNAANARRNYFVEGLSAFFDQHLGRPLHDAVASFATVALGEDVSADDVRSRYRAKLNKPTPVEKL